jgi:hypothetical protein
MNAPINQFRSYAKQAVAELRRENVQIDDAQARAMEQAVEYELMRLWAAGQLRSRVTNITAGTMGAVQNFMQRAIGKAVEMAGNG